jgi:hypothetical protein
MYLVSFKIKDPMRFFFSLALIGLITSYSAQECPDGYIEDCNGNCAPSTWGPDDGYCDDGSASFNLELTLENGYVVWCEGCEEEGYVAIYFNCEEFNWDGSDCETDEGGGCLSDVNQDGYISIEDILLVLSDFGNTCE